MKVFPQKYDELNIEKYDRQLIAVLKSAYKNDDLATLLLCCNPTKTKDGIVHIFICKQGILLINMKNEVISKEDLLTVAFQRMISVKNQKEIIEKRFSYQRSLISGGRIKFPISIVTFFPQAPPIKIDQIPTLQEINQFINKKCIHSNFYNNLLQSKISILELLDTKEECCTISNEMMPDIINRVAPEYTIPQIRSNNYEEKYSSVEDAYFGDMDRAYTAYLLDENQINYINKIKKGNQLIIACAGSGKSIILISKCFKVASLNPDKKFLITGYNRNLVSYFKWLIDSAGFSTNNVECLTFHKLCIKLLMDNNIRLPVTIKNDYSNLLYSVIQNINNKKITNKYSGIFIDEVQMFDPEWYKVCYQLLENKHNDEHFFVICGDKSQSIKKSIKSGKAPWQGHGEYYPNFRGKSFPIETNYRNSIQINNYIKHFTDYAQKYAELLKIDINEDSDIFLRGKAIHQGLDLKIVDVKYKTSEAEAVCILNQIIDIHDNYHIPYNSIAVICFNRKYNYMKNWKECHYRPIELLRKKMNEYNIPYSLLMSGEDEYAVSYANITGVPLVTMESALGLDFKAVILCGLRPIGEHDKTKSINYIKNNIDVENDEISEAYNKNINILYMACARAKDILRIVLTESEDDSLYAHLLRKAYVVDEGE